MSGIYRTIPRFNPAGAIANRFLMSRKRYVFMMGPFGSAKTSHALMRLIYLGIQQEPHPVTRKRETKWAVIRGTYRELEKTTLPSWRRWFPKDFPESEWHGGAGGAPAEHVLRFALKDGTTAEITLQFVAVGEQSAEDTAKGLEISGALLEEADLLPFELVSWLDGRCGRFPAVDAAVGFKGATWSGLMGTFNAPDLEHPLYKWLVEHMIEGKPVDPDQIDFLVQPGGMIEVAKGQYVPNPKAENIQNLLPGYYEKMAGTMPRWKFRRMVLNKFGASRDGAPVYEEYDDELHCPQVAMEPNRGLALRIGLDSSGLHGAAAITQRSSLGQWRVLDEVCSPKEGMGATAYAHAFVKFLQDNGYEPWMKNFGQRHDPARPAITFVYDPAASKDSDGKTWISLFAAVIKRACVSVKFVKAPTNNLTPRIEAVRRPLTQHHGQPDFQINRRCLVLRRGFNAGYKLAKRKVAGEEQFEGEPVKNECSHPHDALQYVMLEGGEYRVILDGGEDAHRAQRGASNPTQSEGHDPFQPGAN